MKQTNLFKTTLLAIALMAGVGNVWGTYSGTGTFTKITDLSGLENGAYYVLYGVNETNTGALTAAVSASQPVATAVTITSNNITDPTSDIVWKLVADGANWKLYNESLDRYCEITADETSGFAMNQTSTHNYTVTVSDADFLFQSNHASADSRCISIYKTIFKAYAAGSCKDLYKMQTGTPSSVATPTLSVESGTYYETFKVGIAPYGTDTVVRYTLDGTTPTASSTVYSSDSISISSTTTLKAIACTTTDTSAIASATYTIIIPTEVNNIAAFLAANAGTNDTVYKITGAVSVTYQNGDNLYVQDNSGDLLISGTQSETYTNGQTLTGVCGTYTLYKGLSKLLPVKMPVAAAGATIEPTVMTLDQITATTQNKYVKVENVQFSQDVSYTAGTAGSSYNFITGVNSLAYYNGTFKLLDGTYSASKSYDVIAIVSVYNDPQLLPISVTEIIPTGPTITVMNVTNDTIAFGSVARGSSKQLTFTVEGVNLTNDITLNSNNEIFTVSPTTITPTEGTVSATTVTVTYAPVANSASDVAVLTISSTGATSITIALTGTCINPTLAAPVAAEASDITATGFTANWAAVENATNYQVNVWNETELFAQDFNSCTGTGGNDGLWSGGIASSDLPTTLDWQFTKGYAADSCVKIGAGSARGIATTPALTNLSGSANLTFKAGAWSGDASSMFVSISEGTLSYNGGAAASEISIPLTDAAWSSYSIEIAGGTATSTITFKGKKASKSRFFLDEVAVRKIIPITNSPFTVSGQENTSLVVNSGLSAETDYKYSVIAIGDNYFNSAESNVINVTTASMSTGLCQPTTIDGVWFDGSVIRNDAHLMLYVYNCQGQLMATGNENISLAGLANGMYIVRHGENSLKVVK